MATWNRLVCGLALAVVALSAGTANAWFGHHHHHHGFGYYGGYGGYSSYYGFNAWPSYSSYGFAPISIGFGYRPSVYYGGCYSGYSNYYAPSYYYTPSYYVPSYSVPVYSYSTYAYPTCSTTPVTSGYTSTTQALPVQRSFAGYSGKTQSANNYAVVSSATSGYSSLKPAVSSTSPSRYVTAGSASVPAVAMSSTANGTPDELMQAADAILAAGGYREASQAYAQLAVRFGSSDQLAMRRFIAQVAGGNYEQAAVIIDLALASGSNLQDLALPHQTLAATLGASADLISQRTEGLAANALQQPNDATPMAAVATWLSLSGDRDRAELFSRRVEQLRGSAPVVNPVVDRLAALPAIR